METYSSARQRGSPARATSCRRWVSRLQSVWQEREGVESALRKAGFKVKDAGSATTGKDYPLKIWSLTVCVPVGVAIVHEGIRPETMANVFYELGLMQAYGRETVG